MKNYFKLISQAITFVIFIIFINLMRLIGIDRASNLGAYIFKIIGPMTHSGWIVRNNLSFIYKDISNEKISSLEKKIWDNFGRYVGEFAFIDENHLKNSKKVEVFGKEIIEDLHKQGRRCIIFSGHFANWDYILYSLLEVAGDAGVVYRKVNNQFIDSYLLKKRSMLGATLIKKGAEGAREIIRLIKGQKNILMLVDQKMNEGIGIPLLNKTANTATGLASLARQYDYAIVPLKIERIKGANFRITFLESFEPEKTEAKEDDIYKTTSRVNDILSGFIASLPDQWLWQHQRWGKPHEMKDE
ncbi:MAG: hypothetical protein SFT91_02625 [Rickettsiaceae bacterium]|nr:hypothetical protein [Rickettsiaceae bacterium]